MGSITRELLPETLAFEPLRMVNMKQVTPTGKAAGGVPGLGLQILELSNLDQIYDEYGALALFYNVQRSDKFSYDGNGPVKKLQGALEELLQHYPHAAGRLCHSETEPGRLQIEYYSSAPSCHTTDNLSHGVPFAVAHANLALWEVGGDVPVLHPSLDLLYPTAPKTIQDSSGNLYQPRPVVLMQVTTFTCGSFCLAIMCSHTLADGHGLATFLQNMCSIARGAGLVVLPADVSISRREVMKPRMPPTPSQMAVKHMTYTIGTRQQQQGAGKVQFEPCTSSATRFPFSTTALETLRLKASGESPAKACTRYLALAALLWTAKAKSLMASRTPRPPASQELTLRFPMNLREKGFPGLTRGYVGNAIFQFTVCATLQELCESPLPSVVAKIKSVLPTCTEDLCEFVQSQIDYIELQLRARLAPCIDYSSCVGANSHVILPFYDTDFGWGRPVIYTWPTWQLGGYLLAILDHPGAEAWNVLTAFSSQEEHASFQLEIAEYIVT